MEQAEIEILVGELEPRLDRLRALYDQYFMGIEKLEPAIPRKDVDRRIDVIRREQIRNTAVRFRFQMLIQRYSTYQSYWHRICRQIEDGTYKRDLVRAKRLLAEETKAAVPARRMDVKEVREEDLEVDLDRIFAEAPMEPEPTVARAPAPRAPPPSTGAERPPQAEAAYESFDDLFEEPTAVVARPAAPAVAKPASEPTTGPAQPRRLLVRPVAAGQSRATPSPPAGSPGERPPTQPEAPTRPRAPPPASADLSEERIRQVYQQYVATRRARQESTSGVSLEAVAKSLRDSTTKLQRKHGAGKQVDFEVTVKDGHTVIRPVIK